MDGPLTDAQLRALAVAVSGPLTDAQLRALAVAISATSLPLPTGAATQTTLAALLAELQAKADLTETQPVSGPLTDAQLRATPIPVSGDSSSALTDAQLRAERVVIAAGTIAAPQEAAKQTTLSALEVHGGNIAIRLGTTANPSAGTVNKQLADILADLQAKADLAETQPVSGPVTDAQLRATAVPVSAASLPLPAGAATSAKQDDLLAMKAKPAVADILSGGRTTSGTVITVPANKVWMGWLHLSMSARSSGVLSTILTWTPGTTGTPTYSPLTVSTAIDAAEVGESIKTETVSSSVWCVLYAGTTAGTIALTGAGSAAHGSANGYVVGA